MSTFKWREAHAGYVNLSHRKDRDTHMQMELKRCGLAAEMKIERVEAIRPSDYKGDPARIRSMTNRTPGATGCHFSQVSIIEAAIAKGRSALVLEDDVLAADDIVARLNYFERFLNTRPWAVAWLGATCHTDGTWHPELGSDMKATDDPRIVRTYGAFSTHGYFVNIDYAADVLRRLDEWLPNQWGIDHGMINRVQPFLPCFAFIPGSLFQLDNQSDIGQGRTVFSAFMKMGQYIFQKRSMDDFDASAFTSQLPKEP